MTSSSRVFAAFEDVFETSQGRCGTEISYRIAGRIVTIRYAGVALAPLLQPAFAHLDIVKDEAADLTILCWDDVSSGIPTPEPGGESQRAGLDYVDGAVRIAWDPADRSLQAFDPSRRRAVFRVPDAGALAAWEQASPFRRILHWWAASLGCLLLHGAAVGTQEGAVLLVGRGGSGKSTTALACVGSALGYLADDYCLVDPGDAQTEAVPEVHALYSSGKADAGSISRLPDLADAFRTSTLIDGAKSIIFVAEHAPHGILLSAPLKAVIVPRIVAGAGARLEPLSRGEALRALAPSTLFQMPGDRAQLLAGMTALIRDLPCWRLNIGGDPRAAQPLIADLIAGHMARGAP